MSPQQAVIAPFLDCLQGDADHAIPVQVARMAQTAMKKIGHQKFVYCELAGVGHQDILTQHKPEVKKLAEWLLEQKRPAPANFPAAEKQLGEWGKQFGWSWGEGIIGHYKKEEAKK